MPPTDLSGARRPSRAARTLTALAAVGGLALAGVAPAAPAHAGKPFGAVEADLNRLVAEQGFPAALVNVRGRDGETRDLTAGVAELGKRRKPPVDGRVRIGSNTKTFVAVVVLQLVDEGKIKLDDSVETYLPGLLRGDGIDGRQITVRQMLQHTSGLPDYSHHIRDYRSTYFEPRDLLDVALAHKAGPTQWRYSNTNYVVAGLLVQKVTGRPIAEEITRRIIKPLKLRDTYFPAQGDKTIQGRHPHGYQADEAGTPRDVTEMDPSVAWTAGQMIASPSDLNRFFAALLSGKLLAPAQMEQMRTTVPAIQPGLPAGSRYGLGLLSKPLPCGGIYWGHGGDIDGYETRGGVTDDGRGVSLVVTVSPSGPNALGAVAAVEEAVATTLCR
nr:serine hydrolase domain-containing protein [Couchioplanes caeruleus]